MSFQTIETELFQASDTRIDDVMINPALQPRRLIYYHELSLRIQPAAQQSVERLKNNFNAPVFGALRIVEKNDGSINELEGEWYDLTGAFAELAEDFAKQNHIATQAQLPRSGRITFHRVETES
jgi:hypothetical protein